MPYKTEEVPAEKLLDHNGVSIFHTYKHDDMDSLCRTYWFVTDAYEGEEQAFDVRELPTWTAPADLKQLDAAIATAMRKAIDAGVIQHIGGTR